MTKQQTKSPQQFTAAEVLKAKYVIRQPSRVAQFRSAQRAYFVNPDGSISSRREMEMFR